MEEEKEKLEVGLSIYKSAKAIADFIQDCEKGKCSIERTELLVTNECLKLQSIAEKMGVILVD